jgi:hypothetical protein
MSILLKRQLNEDEKKIILARYDRKCFANGHAIPDGEQIQFDHVHAYSLGGESELNNIAPMCAQHNKEKGALSLEDFRIKLRLDDFFKDGEKLTLKHFLRYLKKGGDIPSFGQPIAVSEANGNVQLESANRKLGSVLQECPTTTWRYFYAKLPVDLIDSDDDEDHTMGLQPRYLIQDKVFKLFRHFQRHPVLQPSIGRVVDNRIRLFDGQHKVAALLLNGRRDFECKIYLNSELRLLNQTNIAAHDNFAQTRFFSSIMVLKLGGQFGKDFENYKTLESEPNKTESGFMAYLSRLEGSLTQAELNKRFRSYLYSSVLEDADNKLKALVSTSNRGTDQQPLTMDMLQKSLFAALLYHDPLQDSMTTEAYKRDAEVGNVVAILNMFYELALHAWNGAAGTKDGNQRRLQRLVRSKSMMAWAELFRDALCGKLEIQDAEERAKPLYRELSDSQTQSIRKVAERLVGWTGWKAPPEDEIDRVLADNKTVVKDWFKKQGLTTGYLMGAAE